LIGLLSCWRCLGEAVQLLQIVLGLRGRKYNSRFGRVPQECIWKFRHSLTRRIGAITIEEGLRVHSVPENFKKSNRKKSSWERETSICRYCGGRERTASGRRISRRNCRLLQLLGRGL